MLINNLKESLKIYGKYILKLYWNITVQVFNTQDMINRTSKKKKRNKFLDLCKWLVWISCWESLEKFCLGESHRDWRSVNPRNDSLKSTLSPYLLENFLLLQDKKRWWILGLWRISHLFERISLCTERTERRFLWKFKVIIKRFQILY